MYSKHIQYRAKYLITVTRWLGDNVFRVVEMCKGDDLYEYLNEQFGVEYGNFVYSKDGIRVYQLSPNYRIQPICLK